MKLGLTTSDVYTSGQRLFYICFCKKKKLIATSYTHMFHIYWCVSVHRTETTNNPYLAYHTPAGRTSTFIMEENVFFFGVANKYFFISIVCMYARAQAYSFRTYVMRAMRWSSIRYLIIKYFIKVEEFARASGLAYARATEIEYPFTPVYNTFILVYAFICVSLVHFNIHTYIHIWGTYRVRIAIGSIRAFLNFFFRAVENKSKLWTAAAEAIAVVLVGGSQCAR